MLVSTVLRGPALHPHWPDMPECLGLGGQREVGGSGWLLEGATDFKAALGGVRGTAAPISERLGGFHSGAFLDRTRLRVSLISSLFILSLLKFNTTNHGYNTVELEKKKEQAFNHSLLFPILSFYY